MPADLLTSPEEYYRSMARNCGVWATARRMRKIGYPINVAVDWLCKKV